MKINLVFALLFCTVSSLLGQSDRIKELETLAAQQAGEDYIRTALSLSESYMVEQFYEKSLEWVEKAYSAAKKAKLNTYMALALNRQGKVLMNTPSRRSNLKSKAFKCFEDSNRLTTDPTLKMDNLVNLRDLAMLLDKRSELDKILRDIIILKEEVSKHNELEELSNTKQQILEKAEEIQNENQALSETVTNLSQEKDKLRLQQKNLQQMVALKEAAIQNMTTEQMRQELRLSMQERILDSMAFSSILDSMEIAQRDMVMVQQKAELDKAAAEIRLRNSQRNLLLVLAGFGLLLIAALLHRYYSIRQHNAVLAEKNRIIEEERKRSEELLLNILPVTVANELKEKGSAVAKHYEEATVLFADFKGFSSISKQLSPEKLVADLDFAFTNFDKIITRYGLEKIKTIGDAYMCAGGLPGKDSAHPANVVQAAIEIQHFLKSWNQEKTRLGEPVFEARIGIHTGPLVAGVVGSKKFAYDIWGDTVNVAARMESSSEAGKVNISDTTFEQVKNRFNCHYRGKVPAKNVGEVEMYYVEDAVS